jgi:hypothetical protein
VLLKIFKKEMEVNNHDIGESHVPVQLPQPEAATLDIIRTETVLSRLPVHNLAKKGSISIKILKKTTAGEVELLWQISPSRDYGEPRQLAYKLDTIIINQRIDEAGRPLPKMLRLGSLNDVCAELNLATHAGQNAKDLKRAFLQNASAFITAKFNYKGNDGSERRLEAAFTRYGVIFTGEKLPDGRRADAVYIIFNEPFWEVLNNAPVRPLDRTYMKELPPAAQRFYEIVSRKIYAAIKNNYPNANISYSEYCQFSAQLRHTERQRVQDQMAKIIRHHKKSGYIIAVKYEAAIDEQNQPDWILYLTPGPKAYAEFALAHGGRKLKKLSEHNTLEAGEHQPKRTRSGSKHERSTMETAAPHPTFDPQLIAEFTRRGISEKKASQLLVNLKPGQDVVAQLEHTDLLVRSARTPIVNPPGFYIRLIESNTSVPDSFETSAKRKAREERELEERRLDDKRRAQEDLENEYEWYRTEETERYIAALDPAEVATMLEAKRKENEAKHQTPWMIKEFAELDMKREFATRVPLLTIEEFKAKRDQQPGSFFLKPVPDPAPAEAATPEPVATTPATEEVAIDQDVPAPAVDAPAASVVERGEPPKLSPDPATPPVTSEPVILLAAAHPEVEPGGNPTEPNLA